MRPYYIKQPNSRGQMALTPDTTLAFGGINTYEKVVGIWTDGCLNEFVLNSNGTLTYIGAPKCFQFNGVADASVDKACITIFALYKNGVLLPAATSKHGFASASKIGTISITKIIPLNTNDTLEVYAQVDTVSTTITFNTLTITLFGEN